MTAAEMLETEEAAHAPAVSELMQSMGCDRDEARFTLVILLCDLDVPKPKLTPWDQNVIALARRRAREEKDFKTADYLRDVLQRAGCRVVDKPVEVAG